MAFQHGLLWQLSYLKTKSYLFGTIHLNSPLIASHQTVFDDLLNQCSVFAAEVDLDRIDISQMNNYFHLPPQNEWKSFLKANQWLKINEICKNQFGFDLDNYSHIYPMIVLNQLSLQLIDRGIEKSLDQSLWEMAIEKQLQTIGLENFEEHFKLIGKIELKDQIKMLRQFLTNVNRSRKLYLKMLADYHNQDIRAIYKTSRKMLGKYRQLMLFDRNEIMTKRIVGMLSQHNAFITCGAGHLYGKSGILNLLKKQGVKLKLVAL